MRRVFQARWQRQLQHHAHCLAISGESPASRLGRAQTPPSRLKALPPLQLIPLPGPGCIHRHPDLHRHGAGMGVIRVQSEIRAE